MRISNDIFKRLFVFIFLLTAFYVQGQKKRAEQIVKLYSDSVDNLILHPNPARLQRAINELEWAKKEMCGGPCAPPLISYLLGRLKCALKKEDGLRDLNWCCSYYTEAKDEKLLAFMTSCVANCKNPEAIPMPGTYRIRGVNTPGVRSRGITGGVDHKTNYANSDVFKKAKYSLFDTSRIALDLVEQMGRSFDRSDKEEAVSFYRNFIEKEHYSNLLDKTSISEHYVMFHSSKDNGKHMLKVLEENLRYWKDYLKLKEPRNLIVIFAFPNSKLNPSDLQIYKRKWLPTVKIPKLSRMFRDGVQNQNKPKKIKIYRAHRTFVPPYLFKEDYLKFSFAKDGVILNEGDVGYSNPFDNSVVCLSENYLGALNHEVLHLLLFGTYSYCTEWLNEGLASLYEAAKYNKKGQKLYPLNNFRIAELKDSVLYNSTIKKIITSNWTTEQNSQINLAISRYICFYLDSKELLQPFFQSVLSEVSKDEYLTNERIVDLLIQTSGDASFEGFADKFRKFIEDQKKISYKNGKLLKEFNYGSYRHSNIY